MSGNRNTNTYAERILTGRTAESEFSDELVGVGFGEWTEMIVDGHDLSVKFYDVAACARLDAEAQRVVWDGGFLKAWLRHTDGWETAYSWRGSEFQPVEPRRSKREGASAR